MKIKLGAIILLCIFILTGCFYQEYEPYEFRQDFDQIVKIEIVQKEYDSILPDTPTFVVEVLDESEHQTMIDAILSTKGFRKTWEPNSGLGMHIIKIYYQNGEVELLGMYNNGYIPPDGEIHEDNYAFNKEEFLSLLSEWLGEEITEYTKG